MAIILVLSSLLIIGFPLGIILLLIGLVRGLVKKGWKLLIYSTVFLVVIIALYSVSQSFYNTKVGPSVLQNLNDMKLPTQ